jgi:hypothetical protein
LEIPEPAVLARPLASLIEDHAVEEVEAAAPPSKIVKGTHFRVFLSPFVAPVPGQGLEVTIAGLAVSMKLEERPEDAGVPGPQYRPPR